MTENRKKYRRKTYFIKKMFQTKFILLFLLLLFVGSSISGIILYSRTNQQLGYHYGRAHEKLQETGEILKPSLFIAYGISLIIVGIATIILTIYISHKVAGPLYRFERSAEEIRNGNLTVETKIRESDQAKGLAEAFSRMTIDLRKKIQEINLHSQEINQIVEELHTITNEKGTDMTELRKKFGRLDETSRKLCQALKYFKL